MRLGLLILTAAAIPALASPAAAEVIDITSRDATIRLLVQRPTEGAPVAVAALFAGGDGLVEISGDGSIGKLRGNFALRARKFLRARGIVTAVVGPPSDRNSGNGLKGMRATDTYTADLKAVIGDLRGRFQLPVWLHGTSRGSGAAAQAASALAGTPAAPNGIVLSASVLADNKFGGNLLDMAVERIDVPVLVLHHEKDSCSATPPEKVPELIARLSGSPLKKHLTYTEAGNPRGRECGAVHFHGFIGIEARVTGDIAEFILANSAR